jgi:hypothetical protein
MIASFLRINFTPLSRRTLGSSSADEIPGTFMLFRFPGAER